MKQTKKTLIIGAALSLLALYCGDPIPVEEMGTAKHAITKAEQVKAEQYAPEQLKNAREALMASHEFVSNEKLKEAKAKAEEAKKLAEEAYSIAIPQLAKDTRAEAVAILEKAETAYAEEFAKESFNSAKELLASGDEKSNVNQHYKAFLDYESAREEATKARNTSEAQAEVMLQEIAAYREKLAEAKQLGAEQSSPDLVSGAETALNSAQENVNGMMLKSGYQFLETAKADINKASEVARKDWAAKKKIEATGAVERAEAQMVQFKNQMESENMKKAMTDSEQAKNTLKNSEEALSAAQEALSKAGAALDNGEYNESYQNSEEAIRLASMVEDQLPQLMVMLSSGGTAGNNTTETTTSTETKTVGEGWKTYTVRLIPERRDCLWRIAEYDNIYGNPRLWQRIYKANKGQIKNPDLIYPGQVFDIPPKEGDVTKPVKQETKTIEKPKVDEDTTKEGMDQNNQPSEEPKGPIENPADNI